MFVRKLYRWITDENLILMIIFYLNLKRLQDTFPEFQAEWLVPFYEGCISYWYKNKLYLKYTYKGMKSDIFKTITHENWIEEKFEWI